MRGPRLPVSLFLLAGLFAVLAGAALHAAPKPPGNKLVRVPQDARNLAAAIDRVADGGVIELAAGAYPSPGANGFTIANARKGFTVRAATGAVVAIDGGGSRALLRYANSDRARGKQVVFERIIFRNGFSAETGKSGGVTLSKSDALFRNCTFLNNRTTALQTGGAAVKALEGSTASFVNSSFRGNSSQLRGGAMVVRSAVVTIQGGEMVGNRVNLPGHIPNSFGGAIVVIDGTLRVTGVRFEGNQAGWVGGAIYAIGNWTKGSDVLVTRSSFIDNQAVRDPCCAAVDATTGGALHAEDQTVMRVHQSLFVGNRADLGGAVDDYRAVVEVYGSVFQANQATLARPEGSSGGAISVLSSDFADSSTGFGAVNRRAARLVVGQSLFQGGPGIARASVGGGCILAGGDGARQYGGGSVPQAGTLADNRAQVEIRGTVFSDCDVETAGDGTGGAGGAVLGDLVELLMEDSMVLDSDARGANGNGGGVALRQESNARILRTTFARDSAQRSGGALFLSGSNVLVDDSRFYANDVVPGFFEGLNDSRGAAIFSTPMNDPARLRNVSGVVSNSSFSENAGIPLWEVDPPSGAFNDLRYSGNRFSPAAFGDRVYVNNLAAPNGLSTGELNALSVFRAGRPSTPKTQAPNAYVPGLREGSLRAVPALGSVGAAPSAPTSSYLAYAWTGGSASIGTFQLGQKAGLLEVSPGDFTLAVDGLPVVATKALGTCTSGPFLCLAGNRFRAEVAWKPAPASPPVPAQAVAVSGDGGYFSFSDPGSAERAVKVVAQNGSFGVFSAGLTSAEHTLTVTDSLTGAVKTYVNAANTFSSVGDPAAFPAAARRAAAGASAQEEDAPVPIFAEAATCAAGPASLCLAGARFLVELSWKDAAGRTMTGQAVPLTGSTGYFGLSSPGSLDVVVKVLDARGLGSGFWVFQGGLTSVEYTVTVTDTMTGLRKAYTNLRGRFTSRGDTASFPGS